MKNHIYTTKSICIAMLLTMLFPLSAKAGCDIRLADFKLNDSIQCKIPLQKDNIMVSFDDEWCRLDAQQGTMSLSKGKSITIKSQNGEIITGVRLVVTNNDKGDSSDAKRKKTELFSCDNGEFDNGIWKGSSDAVTFQSLENCTITGIRTSFSTDPKEAYATRDYYEIHYGYNDWVYGFELNFHFDEKKHLYIRDDDDGNYIYSINDNEDYPEWYDDDFDYVSFDFSFADYHPHRTSHWFDGRTCEIDNIQYLNTSEVTDMSYMFANFTYKELYDYIPNDLYLNREELFFTSIFEKFDFSSVRDMNHMFADCNMFGFSISSPNITRNADISCMFENCKIKFITIDTKSVNLRSNFFNGVGLGADVQPCIIVAPEDFYFGVDTSAETFLWKGGCFKGFQMQAYVAVEQYHRNSADAFTGESINDDFYITFYYDNKRNVRDKNNYSHSESEVDGHWAFSSISFVTSTYDLTEWEDNKPSELFGKSGWYSDTEK